MKYLEYITILVFVLIRKPLGLVMIYIALPFRKYARNTVYNYVLANGVYLQRLLERPIVETDLYYVIQPYHNSNGGYIKKRKVSWIEYKIVYWFIWGWLDDDCNDDTFDYGHVDRLTKEGGFLGWLVKSATRKHYGNSFDLGDARESNFHFGATTQWTWRNTAYNFRYMQYEKQAGDKNIFLVTIFGKQFGWKKDTDRPSNYSLIYLGID